jgi:Ca-activated chloride channel homolog
MGQRSHRLLIAGTVTAAAALLLALAAAAQQVPTFRSDVRLVRMLVTVKDSYGNLIGNLDRNDFSIFDNGIQQQIAVFDRQSSQPLSIALLVDTSGSTAKDLKAEVEAVRKYLRDVFAEGNPDDAVSLFSFNWTVTEHTGFRRNLSEFDRQLRGLKAEAGTSLYDAIVFASRTLEQRDGRHVMVVVTDGGDTISHYSYQKALEALHMADAVFYGILVMPILNDAGRNVGGENALTQIGQSTGGKVFFPSGGHAIGDPLTEILKDLRTQYLLGFYPKDVPLPRNRFHSVKVQLNNPGLRPVSRSGYYGEYEDGRSTRP